MDLVLTISQTLGRALLSLFAIRWGLVSEGKWTLPFVHYCLCGGLIAMPGTFAKEISSNPGV